MTCARPPTETLTGLITHVVQDLYPRCGIMYVWANGKHQRLTTTRI
jgi:hypothetical protein